LENAKTVPTLKQVNRYVREYENIITLAHCKTIDSSPIKPLLAPIENWGKKMIKHLRVLAKHESPVVSNLAKMRLVELGDEKEIKTIVDSCQQIDISNLASEDEIRTLCTALLKSGYSKAEDILCNLFEKAIKQRPTDRIFVYIPLHLARAGRKEALSPSSAVKKI
jgi:hypothetical protein